MFPYYMPYDSNQALKFIKSIDLTGIPRAIVAQDAGKEAGEIFDQAKKQAQVVGSAVFSFAQGVTAEVREAISDSALLAQLLANKKAPVEEFPLEWFKAYSEVLQNVGWTIQESAWTDYTANGTGIEVHEKIVEVMAVVLGPAPGALAMITSTVTALKALNPSTSWITIFSREAQKAKIARFQIGLVEKDKAGDIFVSLVAYLVQAQSAITQVLFFKFKQSNATLQAKSAKVSINRSSLKDLGPAIRSKIRVYQADYLSSILNL